ncbi:hypothetical protein [Desulfobacula sp.]|uniref:hypothetical protein n=1 Tax=Desulfobacula sp. TaxID=2593537 RepID=UPI002620EBE2|nr:hypothetical protein [Desulfobacula sp.]
MTTELILQKLDDQSVRLSNIETAMALMAVQDEKIITIQKQVSILFKNYDLAFNPKDGVVVKIKEFQNGCPRDTIEKTINRQWAVIMFLVAIVGGKIGGLF